MQDICRSIVKGLRRAVPQAYKSVYFFLPLILFLFAVESYALDTESTGFQVDDGETVDIDVHSNCKKVTNSSGSSQFVSTKTETEWDSFLANLPTNVTVDNCVDNAIYDFGDSSSYNGTAQTVTDIGNLSATLQRGSDSGSDSADPTFSGTANNKSTNEYFSFDGGDYFKLSGTNPTDWKSYHKDNATWSAIAVIYMTDTSDYQFLLGTHWITTSHGWAFGFNDNTGKMSVDVVHGESGVSSLNKVTDSAIEKDEWHFVAVSIDEAGNGFFYKDGNYWQSGSSNTWTAAYTSPSTTDPSEFKIGEDQNGNYPILDGNRINYIKVVGKALTKAEMDTEYETFQRSNHTISLTGSAAIDTNTCTAYTATSIGRLGTAVNVAEDETVNLTGDGNGTFYSDDGCTSSITSTTISNGTDNKVFYYKNATAETETITATAPGIGGGEDDDLAVTVSVPNRTVEIKMWAAGGAGAHFYTAPKGGGGGYAYGSFEVPSGTDLKVVVGTGGVYQPSDRCGGNAAVYGGGGATDSPCSGAGTGGGYSGVFITSVAHGNTLLIAGGGGGAGYSGFGTNNGHGGAGGGSSGSNGSTADAGTHGTGGSSGSGGSGGSGSSGDNGGSGSTLLGGTGGKGNGGDGRGGGGGGGGYYGGGGGGGTNGAAASGGGGGSGYAASTGTINSVAITQNSSTLTGGSGQTPGNSGDADRGGLGDGGSKSDGDDGKVMIRVDGGSWTTYNHTGADQTHNVP